MTEFFNCIELQMGRDEYDRELDTVMEAFDLDLVDATQYIAEYAKQFLQTNGGVNGLDSPEHSDTTHWFTSDAEARAEIIRQGLNPFLAMVHTCAPYCGVCKTTLADRLFTDFYPDPRRAEFTTTPMCHHCAEIMASVSLLALLDPEVAV